jgi:hypothetical protein
MTNTKPSEPHSQEQQLELRTHITIPDSGSSDKFSYVKQCKAGLHRLNTSSFTAPWIRGLSASGQFHGPTTNCIALLCQLTAKRDVLTFRNLH